MRIQTIAVLIVCLFSLACAAGAAENPKVTLDAKDTSLDQVMADLGRQSDCQIMLDSGISGQVTGSFNSIELEKLLDAITNPSGLKWKKLYLPASADQKPTLEQVRARAAAISTITGSTVVVYDPATGKQKVFVEQDPKAPSVDTAKLGLTPVYLISKPITETAVADQQASDTTARFQALETERMSLLANMTSEQRIAATQQEMLAMINLDPTVRQQIMIDQMSARHNMDPQLRDQYRDVMRDTFRVMRERGLVPDWGGRRGGDRGPRGDRNNNPN